jgi:hypothetical protein
LLSTSLGYDREMNKHRRPTDNTPKQLDRSLRLIAASAAATITFACTAIASASTVTYRSGPLTATFSASTHSPNCKQKWPVTVTAKLHGKPTRATAFYQFLFAGQVVSTQYPFGATPKNPHNHLWSFYGSFTDNTFGPFGAASVGQPLKIRAVVRASGHTAYPAFPVNVVSATGCPPR